MADGGNIIEIVFRATVDKLKAGLDQARNEVSNATSGIKDSVASANSAVSSSTSAMEKSLDNVARATQRAGSAFRNSNKEMADIRTVQAAIDGKIQSVKELTAIEAAYDRLQMAGMGNAIEEAALFEALAEAEGRLTKEKAKDAAAQSVVNKETKEAIVLSNAHRRQLSSMGVQALTGQWRGLTTVTATFLATGGLLSTTIAAIVAGIGALIAALAIVTIGYISGQKASYDFERAVAASGNAAGITAEKAGMLAEKIAGGNVTITEARKIIMAMIQSGAAFGDQFEDAAQVAADFARTTGKSMEESVRAVVALGDDPVKAVVDLNKSMNFLTAAEYEHIRALEQTVGKAAATEEALNLLKTTSAQRAKELEEHAGWVVRGWEAVRRKLADVKNAILDIGRTDNADAKRLAEIEGYMDALRKKEGIYKGLSDTAQRSVLARFEAEAKLIRARIAGSEQAAQAQAKENQTQKDGVAAVNYFDQLHTRLDRTVAKTKELTELQRQYIALFKANPDSPMLADVTFNAKGVPSGGQYDKDKAAIEKQYEVKPERKDKSAEREAHRLKMEQMQQEMTQLGIERDATEQASLARIEADKKIVEAAKRNYGEKSQAFRAALNQQESDERAHDQLMAQLDNVKLEMGRQLLDMQLEQKRSMAEDDYHNGRITAEQLLGVERELIAQKLAAELDYYQQKKAMAEAAGDTVAAAQAAAAIEVAQARATIDMRSNEVDFQNESISRWQRWGDTIAGSLAGVTNNMIFNGMKFKDAFINVMGDLLQNFIGFCSQMLSKWIATKFAEVSATVAGNAVKVASDRAAAKESVTANAGAAIKKIIANAAEVFTSVYKAIAGIPYVGPFLAPVMAVAAGATVIGMVGKVASAEKGWERVPSDGMITELHKDEQVLPAEYAEGLREMVAGGGKQRQPIHVHINALDRRSVERMFADNASALMKVVRDASADNPGGF